MLTVSLIVTTYNREDALELVLTSALKQSVLPAEILVADDGSTSETREMLDRFRAAHDEVPIHHVWHEDMGFRVGTIRNKAIAQARSEYILLIDGDILLHKHFVQDHLRVARKGQWVQGRRVILSEEYTQALLSGSKRRILFWDKGITNRMNMWSCPLLSAPVSRWMRRQGIAGVRSCNMGVFREDIFRCNGFNEDFEGWGREDSEFAVRLLNSGVRRLDLRLGGVGYHLYHPMSSRTRLEMNDRILEESIRDKKSYCENGVSRYL